MSLADIQSTKALKLAKQKANESDIYSKSNQLLDPSGFVFGYDLQTVFNVSTPYDLIPNASDAVSNIIFKDPIDTKYAVNKSFFGVVGYKKQVDGSYKRQGTFNPVLESTGKYTITVTANCDCIRVMTLASNLGFNGSGAYIQNNTIFCLYDKWDGAYHDFGFSRSAFNMDLIPKNGITEDKLGANIRLNTPTYIDMVVNKNCNLYSVGLVDTQNKDFSKYRTYISGGRYFTAGVSTINLTADAKGQTAFVYDKDGNVVEQKTIDLLAHPIPTNPGSAKNILMIGDSLFASTIPEDRFYQLLTSNSLTNYKLVGRTNKAGNVNVRYEATGGYHWENYVNNPSTLPAGYPNNWFWNPNTTQLDINYYMTTYCGGASLDYLIINLGWNGRVNSNYWKGDIPTTVANVKTLANTLIQHVNSKYPNCKILLIGIQKTYIGNNAASLNLGDVISYRDYCTALNIAYKDLATTYSSYVRFLQMSAQFDTQYGHQTSTMTTNPYSTETVTYCLDHVHPNDNVGYQMWGDAVFNSFCGLVDFRY